MRKNTARLTLLAATAVMAITPVAASASHPPSTPSTRTQNGDSVDQRNSQNNRALGSRFNSSFLPNFFFLPMFGPFFFDD